MGKYLIIWEADESRIPEDPQERKAGWLAAVEMTRQDTKSGIVKDWGGFVGQPKGYWIAEGTEVEVTSATVKYMPFFRYKAYPLSSLDQTEEVIKSIS